VSTASSGLALLLPAGERHQVPTGDGTRLHAIVAGAGTPLVLTRGALRAQRDLYLAAHIQTVRLAGGRNVLRIEFAAPSLLGFLGPSAPSH
jgi:hypothetical protein